MRLREKVVHDAPPAQVWAVLTDAGFQHDVAERSGAQTWRAAVTDLPGGGRRLESTRTLTLPDEVPDFARRFIGRAVQVRRVDEWDAPAGDGSVTGRTEVGAHGVPVTVSGTVSLTPAGPRGARTCSHLDLQIRATVPLVGRRIEQAVGPVLLAAWRDEQRAGADRLAGQSPPMWG